MNQEVEDRVRIRGQNRNQEGARLEITILSVGKSFEEYFTGSAGLESAQLEKFLEGLRKTAETKIF